MKVSTKTPTAKKLQVDAKPSSRVSATAPSIAPEPWSALLFTNLPASRSGFNPNPTR